MGTFRQLQPREDHLVHSPQHLTGCSTCGARRLAPPLRSHQLRCPQRSTLIISHPRLSPKLLPYRAVRAPLQRTPSEDGATSGLYRGPDCVLKEEGRDWDQCRALWDRPPKKKEKKKLLPARIPTKRGW